MSDDAIESMEAGRIVSNEWAMSMLPGGKANEGGIRQALLDHEATILGGSATNDDDNNNDGGGGVTVSQTQSQYQTQTHDDDNDGGGGASLASNRAITATHPDVKKYLKDAYPLHYACRVGASLDVIKYLVEEGKEPLNKADNDGFYPLHYSCRGGASLDVIKYLGDKEKKPLVKADNDGFYPLHYSCRGGASLDVIKYLGDKEKEPLVKADNDGFYPLHYSCRGGASLDVIKYLIQKKPDPLQYKDRAGLTALDYMDNTTLRAIWGTTLHQTGSVADKSSDIDRLNYLHYARALAYSARQAEQPESSLCIGLNGRWGGGKTTLWKQTKKCLYAEFLQADAQSLHNVCQLSGASYYHRKAAKYAKIPFNNAVEKLVSDPYVLNDAKKAWREKSQELPTDTAPLPLTFLEHLAGLFLRIFCAHQSCRERYEDEVGNDDRYGDDVQTIQRIEIKSQDARSRRMETNAIFFLIFLITLSPIWIVYWPIYLQKTCCKSSIARCCNCSDDIIKKEANHIAGIITGDVDLGEGDSAHWDVAPCGTFFVITFLQIARAIVSGISLAFAALHHIMCCQWCCSKTNHPPTGAVKYKFVEFNAWTYQGSELLWASLMKELWDAVEAEFGKKVVRYHRAGIALAEENQYDESHCTLTPQQKAQNRKKALLMFRARLYLYLFLFFIVLTVLITLTITNCKSINRTCLGKVVNVTNNATDIIEAVESDSKEEGNEGGVITATIATVAAFCLLLAKVGVVKTEIDYLFDLLKTETYLDKETGCNRSIRLCVFIDDLDRCPPELVVSVLEAVILLLVDGPISVWMAIDSRIVVQCIEAKKVGVFDKANISGHEFLDKIVQLPFAIPELTNDAKKSYLDKIIDEKELDPARVLSRFMCDAHLNDDTSSLLARIATEVIGHQNKDPFFTLVRIATGLDKSGLIIPRRDRKAVIGMTESELIKLVAENPHHASDEHRENLCSIVLQATSQLIRDRLGKAGDQKPSESYSKGNTHKKTPETDSNAKGNSHNPDAGDDIVLMGPPPSGLYVPMLNENDRRCLEDFIPFIDGNPRRMKRIINVFNVARRITELQRKVSPQLTAKILKMVILLEQWPYRMAWLLQLIEDINQMSTHRVEDSRMNQFLEECLGRREDGKSWWDMICGVGILQVYRRIVCELLLMSKVDSSNMVTKDSDPQLFEGLLQCNGNDELSSSEEPYAIIVQDMRPLGCNMEGGEYETCLRSYMFNMPQAITDKVSVMMNKALMNYVGRTLRIVGKA
eukprot:scaffold5864_cov93-Skeletonema_dohrnii-CCMP3373.AAC.9